MTITANLQFFRYFTIFRYAMDVQVPQILDIVLKNTLYNKITENDYIVNICMIPEISKTP